MIIIIFIKNNYKYKQHEIQEKRRTKEQKVKSIELDKEIGVAGFKIEVQRTTN